MLTRCLAKGAEDDAVLRQLGAICGADRDRVEDGIDRHAGEDLLLAEGDAQLLVGLQQLGIDIVQRAQRLGGAGRRVVADVLVVDRVVLDVGPAGLAHLEPATVGLEAPLEQPRRLLLLLGDEPDDVLAQPLGGYIRLDVGDEAVLVFPVDQGLDGRAHSDSSTVASCSPFLGKRTAYEQAPSPCSKCSRRSTRPPSVRSRKRCSAVQISGNRSETARMAQWCSVRVPQQKVAAPSAM